MTASTPSETRAPRWLAPVAALRRHRGRLAAAELPAAPVAETSEAAWVAPIGPWRVMFDPGLGCELLEPRRPTPLPGAPAWLPGVVNLRGNLVPVFDLAQCADPPQRTVSPRLLAVGEGEAAAVLAIGGMPFRHDPNTFGPPLADPPAALPPALAGAIRDAWRIDGELWLACDLPALFSELGRQAGRA
ncbi:chemotaxis protein CheW [Spiribacter halobius]|nr:chemotaxis protein CheW [Spiribacter halobius]UEX77076.1 chemotaxis protein CheW [Spiribacter halobius]